MFSCSMIHRGFQLKVFPRLGRGDQVEEPWN
jgi:hypothetical protein